MEIMTDIQTKRPTNRHTNQPVDDEQELQIILKNAFVETKVHRLELRPHWTKRARSKITKCRAQFRVGKQVREKEGCAF